jgi:hypothetical protein
MLRQICFQPSVGWIIIIFRLQKTCHELRGVSEWISLIFLQYTLNQYESMQPTSSHLHLHHVFCVMASLQQVAFHIVFHLGSQARDSGGNAYTMHNGKFLNWQ